MRVVPRSGAIWNQDFYGLTEQFLPLIAEELFRNPVQERDPAFPIDLNDRIRSRLQELTKPHMLARPALGFFFLRGQILNGVLGGAQRGDVG
jgi:hypothetical protein